jgi:hypothetical protein
MALHSLSFMGMAPFGSLLAGWAASYIGVARTISLSGVLVLFATALFASRLREVTAHAAPVYSRLGMAGEAAEELSEAEHAERPV